jgi:hypothetical protein
MTYFTGAAETGRTRSATKVWTAATVLTTLAGLQHITLGLSGVTENARSSGGSGF